MLQCVHHGKQLFRSIAPAVSVLSTPRALAIRTSNSRSFATTIRQRNEDERNGPSSSTFSFGAGNDVIISKLADQIPVEVAHDAPAPTTPPSAASDEPARQYAPHEDAAVSSFDSIELDNLPRRHRRALAREVSRDGKRKTPTSAELADCVQRIPARRLQEIMEECDAAESQLFERKSKFAKEDRQERGKAQRARFAEKLEQQQQDDLKRSEATIPSIRRTRESSTRRSSHEATPTRGGVVSKTDTARTQKPTITHAAHGDQPVSSNRKSDSKADHSNKSPPPPPLRPLKEDTPEWGVQKRALAEKFGDEGWNPRRKLSPDAMLGIKTLHASDPETYTTPMLAEQFKVSAEAIRRILKSKWITGAGADKVQERRERWAKRHDRIWDQQVALGLRPPRRDERKVRDASEGADEVERQLWREEVLDGARKV